MPSTRRPRRNKYGNVPVVIDNIRFASTLEGKRYGELRLLARTKSILDLRCHPEYVLDIAGERFSKYIGDFEYRIPMLIGARGGPFIVCEDTKGVQTEIFRLKWKLVKLLYPGIDFRLITKKRASSGCVGERAAA